MKLFDVMDSIPACNYSLNRNSVEGICYHITGDSNRGQTLAWFRNPLAKVSAHYIIEKNGDVFLCVHPEKKAYHCGKVQYAKAKIYFDKGQLNPNGYLIGIECVSSGEPLTSEQWQALISLTLDLCNIYKIPLDRYNLIGHNELDTVEREHDPVMSYKVEDVVNAVALLKMKGAKEMTTDEALAVLVAKGIITSPEYWVKVLSIVKYFDTFIINIAKALAK